MCVCNVCIVGCEEGKRLSWRRTGEMSRTIVYMLCAVCSGARAGAFEHRGNDSQGLHLHGQAQQVAGSYFILNAWDTTETAALLWENLSPGKFGVLGQYILGTYKSTLYFEIIILPYHVTFCRNKAIIVYLMKRGLTRDERWEGIGRPLPELGGLVLTVLAWIS